MTFVVYGGGAAQACLRWFFGQRLGSVDGIGFGPKRHGDGLMTTSNSFGNRPCRPPRRAHPMRSRLASWILLGFGLTFSFGSIAIAANDGAPGTVSTATVQPLESASEGRVAAAGTEAVAEPKNPEGCGVEELAPASFGDQLKLKLSAALDSGNLWLSALLVLLAGFGVTLTPCVYPLIPITLSIFGARSAASRWQGFTLSATYVGGMVLLYSALGIGFALAGKVMGGAMQNPIVTTGVALFCLAMASSMFGAFELALPSGLQNTLSQAGGAGYRGAFVMGLVAGLIAAPCTGPVLTLILTLIARNGEVWRGGVLMVVFSIGVGIPFLILGTFSSALSRLPKSGPWTEAVKSVFGMLMIVAGLYFLSLAGETPASVLDALRDVGVTLGGGLILVGALLGALHLSFKYTSTKEKIRKGIGLTFAGVGAASILSWAVSGPIGEALIWQKVTEEVNAVQNFEAFLANAQENQKPVMIDFFADWCAACKELDKFTYTDEEIQIEAQRFSAIKVDATEDTPGLAELQKRFGVIGLPTVVFLNSSGQTCTSPRVTGFIEPEPYLKLMRAVR